MRSFQQLTESDCASNVCADCYKFIADFEQFTERCTKVHLLFNDLISSTDLEIDSIYLQTLRYEAGLDRDEVRKNSKEPLQIRF